MFLYLELLNKDAELLHDRMMVNQPIDETKILKYGDNYFIAHDSYAVNEDDDMCVQFIISDIVEIK